MFGFFFLLKTGWVSSPTGNGNNRKAENHKCISFNFMPDLQIEVDGETATGAAFGASNDANDVSKEIIETPIDGKSGTDDSKDSSIESGTDVLSEETIDLESLLHEETETPDAEKPEAGAEAEANKEEDVLRESGKVAGLLAEIKQFRADLAALPGDQLSEKQNKSFGIMRKATETALDRLEQISQDIGEISRFGKPEEVREAVELKNSLYEYDVKNGYQSPEKFAVKLAQADADHAFRTAAYILAQTNKDGLPLIEGFVSKILQLDPNKLEEFQARSKGEVLPGEEMSFKFEKSLEQVPTEYHDAFRRLSSKQKALVDEGFDQYATEAEKIEALQILRDSKVLVDGDRAKQIKEANMEKEFLRTVDTNREVLSSKALEAVSKNIHEMMQKIVFSTNKETNAAVRYGITKAVFDFENPVFRSNAIQYFTDLGVPESEVKRVESETGRLLTELDNWIEIKAHAEARLNIAKQSGDKANEAIQQQEMQKAEDAFQARINRLSGLGRLLAVKSAQKLGAVLASKTNVKIPENNTPNFAETRESSSNGERRSYPASAYAKAAAEGRVLGRS